MKIVLVRPPFYALFGVTAPKMKTYPLNLLYLATYAAHVGGHETAIVDGENITVPELQAQADPKEDPEITIHRGIPRMIGLLSEPEHPLWLEVERQVRDLQPDLVGITCASGNMDTVKLLVGRLKRLGIPVILGGSHPTVLPEQSIAYTNADMAAVGEGELTLVRVADALAGKSPVQEIPSFAWRENGTVRVNPCGELITPLDMLPIPDRTLIDRRQYFGEVIMTGRGCPFDCAYCASRTIWGRRVRLRSVSSIVDELEMLKAFAASPAETGDSRGTAVEPAPAPEERPGRWVVKILDDTFTVNRKRTLNLLEEIVRRGLNCFEFTGGVRADTLDEELVEHMQQANFRRVTLGVESGSPRILKLIRKGETNEDVIRAIGLLRAAGIKSHAFFMIGLPGEGPEDIELSKKLILESRPDYVEINMVTPYPGTDIFDKLIREDPSTIDRWYRWFHQGMATHSDLLGYDLDAAYEAFVQFARQYAEGKK